MQGKQTLNIISSHWKNGKTAIEFVYVMNFIWQMICSLKWNEKILEIQGDDIIMMARQVLLYYL